MKNFTHKDIAEGDIVTYIAFGGERRRVRVTNVEEDIKNGRPGFDGDVLGDTLSCWGYCSQITRVEKGDE
jgi:hypothetical protein